MTAKIILCSNCGAHNRIPKEKTKQKAACSDCSNILAVIGSKRPLIASLLGIIVNLWFVWVLVFIFIVLPHFENSTHKNSNGRTSNIRKISPDETLILDNGVLLTDGQAISPVEIKPGIISKSFASGVAPLEIKTQIGNDYYVKIVNIEDNKPSLTAYIIGGHPLR